MSGTISGKVRLALIGTGGIAGAHVRGVLKHDDRIQCIALCDVSQKALAQRNEQLGGGAALFRDWKKMLGELDDGIDAVDICLPHHLHARAILDACAAGKHILCEKPMCTTLKDADRIAAAVRGAGVTYMAAHNELFYPVVCEAKRLIAAGKIGRLRWLRSQECFVAPAEVFRGAWRADAKRQGGGELIDTGYHPIYRLLHLAGSEVVGVRGSMARFQQKIDGEDTAMLQVRFANGVLGEVLTSWAFERPFGTHQIHAVGDKGELFGSANRVFYRPAGCTEPARIDLAEADTFAEEVAHFADCLRRGKRPLHSVEEGRAVLEIILEATKDARGWENVGSKKPRAARRAPQ